MKKRVFIFALTIHILITINISFCFANDFDFRKVVWGMTKEAVLDAEELKPIDQDIETISYNTIILRKNVKLIYRFSENKLVAASYTLTDKYLNTRSYIESYYDFAKALTEKYGTPSNQEIVWLDDTYKNNPSKRNLALSAGHLQYHSNWSTDETSIRCNLFGSYHNLILQIEYFSKSHLEIIEKSNESFDDI